jgi:hypothetical protein
MRRMRRDVHAMPRGSELSYRLSKLHRDAALKLVRHYEARMAFWKKPTPRNAIRAAVQKEIASMALRALRGHPDV